MTPEQAISLIQACKASGVSSFKFGELEVQFGSHTKVDYVTQQVTQAFPSHSAPLEISLEEEKEIKHKVEELTSIMKLDDNELINRMFPLPENEAEGVA